MSERGEPEIDRPAAGGRVETSGLRGHRFRRFGAGVLTLLIAASCSGRRFTPDTEPHGAVMGVYRVRLEGPDLPTRRFRLLLYATLPDRVHGEILSPVGTTELILDGGAGRIAVTLPRRRLAYTGSADAAALEKVLGVRVSLAQLVNGLLGETTELQGYELDREPAGKRGLPRSLRIEGGGSRLSLRLKSEQPLRVSTESLGNGEPPAGMERRPLEQLGSIELPDDGGPGGSG